MGCAGNTDGNTLGDAISAAVVSHYFAAFGPLAERRRQLSQDALAAYIEHVHACASGDASSAPALQRGSSDAVDPPLAPCTGACASGYRTVLRVVEDCNWQAQLRQTVEAYVNTVRRMGRGRGRGLWWNDVARAVGDTLPDPCPRHGQVDGDSWYTLNLDLAFYQRMAFKVLGSRTLDTAAAFHLPWQLQASLYPWNRTFEVGLYGGVAGPSPAVGL